MKKVIVYFILFILLIFLFPIFCTKRYEKIIDVSSLKTNNEIIKEDINIEEKSSNNNESEKNKYDYGKYNIIKLLHKKENDIEEISLDEYLYGVVSAEMPVSFEEEALKAQAIVARTYTIYKIIQGSKHENADICDDSKCCQAWISKEDRLAKWDDNKKEEKWNKIVKCVKDTEGKIVTYDNKPINAFFHSNSGGKTEVPINVWGGEEYPYLQVVETIGENEYQQYSSTAEFTKEELINKIKEKHNNLVLNNLNEVKIVEYTESLRVKTIQVGNIMLSGVELRMILELKSTNFNININDNKIRFDVIGYGHGVGMSQTGADVLAKKGYLADDILKHFYIGVEIKYINKE